MQLLNVLNSSIGKKYLMAVTGILLSGFLVAHLGGNLLVYVGPDMFNTYAHKMKTMPTVVLVWGMRAALLTFFLSHIISGIRLSLQNKGARPVKYAKNDSIGSSFSSRTMIYSGILIALFVGYHLAHFTLHWTHPSLAEMHDSLGRHDAYRMVVTSFSSVLISSIYISAMIALWFHLCHGAGSVFQSLGINYPKLRSLTNIVGPAFATVIIIGNCSIPLAVLFNVIGA